MQNVLLQIHLNGTIFGAKFGKKLAVIIRDSNRNKLEDLTKRLGIEGHILTNINELEDILSIELDRVGIDDVLEEARKETFKYLEEKFVTECEQVKVITNGK